MAPARRASMRAKSSGFARSRNKRPYVRKEVEPTALVYPSSPPQLAEYAYNIHGWALEDGIKNRGTFEIVNAYNCTMLRGGFAAKIEEFKAGNQTNIYRNDLKYTARELDTTLPERDAAVAQYLVVGYTLQEDDPYFEKNKTFSRYSDNELVGESVPSAANLIKWNSCRTPILVVTPIKDNTGTSVRLFGLVKPTSDLCQPVLLQHERIFYRWEFRASAGAKPAQRNKNWNQLVVDKARQLTPLASINMTSAGYNRDCMVIQPRAKRNKQVYKKEVEEEYNIEEALDPDSLYDEQLELILDLSLVLQSRGFAGAYPGSNVFSKINLQLCEASRESISSIKRSNTDHVIQELRFVFTKFSKSAMVIDFPQDKAISLLQHFSNLPRMQIAFDGIEAQMVSDEIKYLWPILESSVQPWKLMRIKEAMTVSNIGLAPEHMEEFFKNALTFFNYNPHPDSQVLTIKVLEWINTSMALFNGHRALVDCQEYYLGVDGAYLVVLLRYILMFDKFQSAAMSSDLAQARLFLPLGYNCSTYEYNFVFDSAAPYAELPLLVFEIMEIAKVKNCDLEDVMIWLERIRSYIRQA